MSTAPDGLDGDCPPWGEPAVIDASDGDYLDPLQHCACGNVAPCRCAPVEYECRWCHRLWTYRISAERCCEMDDG